MSKCGCRAAFRYRYRQNQRTGSVIDLSIDCLIVRFSDAPVEKWAATVAAMGTGPPVQFPASERSEIALPHAGVAASIIERRKSLIGITATGVILERINKFRFSSIRSWTGLTYPTLMVASTNRIIAIPSLYINWSPFVIPLYCLGKLSESGRGVVRKYWSMSGQNAESMADLLEKRLHLSKHRML